ncbi:hypothetical protein BC831DRAFT_465877, partial [Entophlyctis helioformis]
AGMCHLRSLRSCLRAGGGSMRRRRGRRRRRRSAGRRKPVAGVVRAAGGGRRQSPPLTGRLGRLGRLWGARRLGGERMRQRAAHGGWTVLWARVRVLECVARAAQTAQMHADDGQMLADACRRRAGRRAEGETAQKARCGRLTRNLDHARRGGR